MNKDRYQTLTFLTSFKILKGICFARATKIDKKALHEIHQVLVGLSDPCPEPLRYAQVELPHHGNAARQHCRTLLSHMVPILCRINNLWYIRLLALYPIGVPTPPSPLRHRVCRHPIPAGVIGHDLFAESMSMREQWKIN